MSTPPTPSVASGLAEVAVSADPPAPVKSKPITVIEVSPPPKAPQPVPAVLEEYNKPAEKEREFTKEGFGWSYAEEVYPFESGVNGQPLFCREFYFLDLSSDLPHNIENWSKQNNYFITGSIWNTISGAESPTTLPLLTPNGTLMCYPEVDAKFVRIRHNIPAKELSGKIRYIYSKS